MANQRGVRKILIQEKMCRQEIIAVMKELYSECCFDPFISIVHAECCIPLLKRLKAQSELSTSAELVKNYQPENKCHFVVGYK